MKIFTKPIVAVLTAFVLLAAVAIAMPQVQPAAANTADGYALYTWTNNKITSSTNGAARFTGDYGQLECYQTVDADYAQTVTTKFQSSPDGVNWSENPVWQFGSNVLAVAADYTDVTTDTTLADFAIVVLYGEYTRPVITLGESNPVTVTLKCVAKDTTFSINDQAGAHESTD